MTILAVSLILLSAADGAAQAFHDRGVATCEGCHILHDSQDGMAVAFGQAGEALLRESNPTDLCLSCHAESLGEVMGFSPTSPPAERGPGNFVFLLENNLGDAGQGSPQSIPGERGGHNVRSDSYAIGSDLTHALSPGGTYPSEDLGCVSCHDPHGNASYRMLYGGQQSTPEGFVFLYDSPQGEGLPAGEVAESTVGHVAYLGGWSQWCANCHGMYHESGSAAFEHPVNERLYGDESDSYNQYAGDLNPLGGDFATAYLPEVPLQSAANTPTSTFGSDGSGEINCMTCHRAHATSAPHALRWDPNVLTLGEDGMRSGSWPIPNPYFDPAQRSLCVKCHEVMARDHHDNRPCMGCHGSGGGGGTVSSEPTMPAISGP